MRVITLSGWGQPQDALSGLWPGATHVEYANKQSLEDALLHIEREAKNADALIGWSLGGQLALRATAAGLIAPKKLVLIAAPFQFVKSPQLMLGMPRDQYERFRGNYARNAERTLDKAWELVVKGDAEDARIRRQFTHQKKQQALVHDWLSWLDRLERFTFHGQELKRIPPSLLIHGEQDVVVGMEQSKHFVSQLPEARLVTFKDCGHAPHWHNACEVQTLVKEFLHV